jgi:hypothetical protein
MARAIRSSYIDPDFARRVGLADRLLALERHGDHTADLAPSREP